MRAFACMAVVVATMTAEAIAAQTPDLTPYLMPDRAAEVALARSAAPKELSNAARVLVLSRTGFVEGFPGSNGFTCLVLRSFSGRLNDPDFWNARVRAPRCFNAPAARTVLAGILRQVDLLLGGMSTQEVAARMQKLYRSRALPLPAVGAMAYALSPRQYLTDADPQWMPHLMFFYDRTQPLSTWGAGGETAPIIDGSAGDPKNPVVTLLIPVRRWSDGTPALKDSDR